MESRTDTTLYCSHCGEKCPVDPLRSGDLVFCCEGCRMVYELLDSNGLCNYYRLNEHPGINRRITVRKDKFAFLDDPKVAEGLVNFQDDREIHVTFYLPQIHCSSCLYLLEQLHRLDEGVISARVDFTAKEVAVIADPGKISLRGVAELLTSLGYEPHISLRDWEKAKPKAERGLIYALGVAGFCFANIMLISFPEYLGLDKSEATIREVLRYLNLLISLPVVFYSARPFYHSAWSGLRHKFLNIDAPIVLAIAVTFGRSTWEVISGTGPGYFDSLSGIVFFMLLGRVLQDRTYRRLAFDRDYTSYFPVAVSVVQTDKATGREQETVKTMPDIRNGDTLRIHSGELIPADGLLTRGQAWIDYSFVTGESQPVEKQMGELVYAGGRQKGGAIEVLVVREVAQSYLTQLWNRQGKSDAGDVKGDGDFSFVHPLSRYFTYVVLAIATGAALFWGFSDPSKVLGAVTAVLIVACPCALLLSSTFTNGNLLRILGRNHFYLRNAEVIERIAKAKHIVFDKTGTLTIAGRPTLAYSGELLTQPQKLQVATLAAQSNHPLCRALAREWDEPTACTVLGFRETEGRGVEGYVNGDAIALGSLAFVSGKKEKGSNEPKGTRVYVAINQKVMGNYQIGSSYREGLAALIHELAGRMKFSVLSGDNSGEKENLRRLLGDDTELLFDQAPVAKSKYIERLQEAGSNVMMIGDGLNDAGALRQSDIGIALSEDCNNFTPASDAILRADRLAALSSFIRLCRAGKRIILASFILSVLYNIIGLSFAVSGLLSPMVAAILMPASSLTILLVTYGSSNLVARWLRI